MATYTPRTTAPSTSNRFYYSDNVFYQSGFGIPNCTCYAWGRFYELSGERPKLSTSNAENWYNHSDGYKRGKTPKLGAVIVWAKGSVGNESDGAGHVAIVEQINSDGSIVTSNSAWGGSEFYMQNIGSNYALSGYTFLGFIYNPIDFEGSGTPDETYTPPEPVGGNYFLSESEMKNNAEYIAWHLLNKGWTLNAIAGMLGNMETESTINPKIWESLDTGNTSGGYGLVQWTPATKLIEWASGNSLDYTDMDTQLERILWEVKNGGQYYSTDNYPESFAEFTKSTKSPEYLAWAFLLNYERPSDQNQPNRATQGRKWYDYLKNINFSDGSSPQPDKKKYKKMGLLLMYMATKR